MGWEYHSVPPTFCHSGFKGYILALPELHEINDVRPGLHWNLRMFLAIRGREETLSLSGQQVGTRWTHNTQV